MKEEIVNLLVQLCNYNMALLYNTILLRRSPLLSCPCVNVKHWFVTESSCALADIVECPTLSCNTDSIQDNVNGINKML